MIIKNFGRWALISGMVLGVSALTPLVALAAPVDQDETMTVTIPQYTSLSWTTQNLTHAVDYGSGYTNPIVNKSLGTVNYTTNVVGHWSINAVGNGQLKIDGETGANIPYQVELADPTGTLAGTTEGLKTTATGAGALLLKGQVMNTTNDVTEGSATLNIQIAAEATKVPAGTYTDTINLVFESGLVAAP